jgi:hypothetical protein
VPPRFAYWTILIDNAPTAFRAREAEELLPTLAQLRRTNENVILKWFARGRLWDSQQQERDDFQRRKWRPAPPHGGAAGEGRERRSKDWRPGGDHRDPRARFNRETKRDNRPQQKSTDHREKPWQAKTDRPGKPWHAKKSPQRDRPWHGKPESAKPRGEHRRFKPRKPHGPPFKTRWTKDRDPRKKREPPEDE